MSFRDMLVHAPDHRRWSPHVAYAARLAARRQSRAPCLVLPTLAEDDKAGVSLVAQAQAMHAQLVVMGAYGHPRLSEWILGGATHHVLRHSPVPLFMAH